MPYRTTEAVARMRAFAEAKVPYVHQGTTLAGADCVGGLVYAFQYDGKLPPYSKDPINGELEKELNKIFGAPFFYRKSLLAPLIEISELQELDVLSMQYRGPVRHIAMVVNHVNIPGALSVIHMDSNRDRVVEHILDLRWIRRIVGAWRPEADSE